MGGTSKSWKTKFRQIHGQVESSSLWVGAHLGGEGAALDLGHFGGCLHRGGTSCSLGAVAQLFSAGWNFVGAAFAFPEGNAPCPWQECRMMLSTSALCSRKPVPRLPCPGEVGGDFVLQGSLCRWERGILCSRVRMRFFVLQGFLGR